MDQSEFDKWAWTDETIQWMAEPYKGAVDQIRWLSRFAEIHIISSTCHPTLLPKWLKKYDVPYNKAIITDKKGECEWDVLLDDNPFTLIELADRNVLRHNIAWNAHLVNIKSFNWR
jgi:5'(3')-deoxyribonucleotidase